MEELKQQTEKLDKRLTDAENTVSAMENRGIRQDRVLSYLLQEKLTSLLNAKTWKTDSVAEISGYMVSHKVLNDMICSRLPEHFVRAPRRN